MHGGQYIHGSPSGMKMLVYSGDTDGAVPVAGTRYAMSALKLPIVKSW